MSLHEDPDLWSPAPLCGPKSVGKMLGSSGHSGEMADRNPQRWRQTEKVETAHYRIRACTREYPS